MGHLILPKAGIVCLDTSAVIYAVEGIEPFADLLAPLWKHAADGAIEIKGSQLLLLESLVKPVRDDDSQTEAIYREVLTGTEEFHLLPITLEVVELAIHLRAEHGLRTPDAIHAATALIAGCVQFLTNDIQFRRVKKLPVIVLSDYVRNE